MDSLFFALQPDAAAAARAVALAARLRADHGLRTPPTGMDRLHVTLYHLGPADALPDLVARAQRAAATLDSPAFDVSFDLITSFKAGKGNKHPHVLMGRQPMQALQVFRFNLGVALGVHGVAADKRAFTPHLTLLRDTHAMPEQSVAPIAWTAREFVLVRSLIGQGRHVVLERWPLRA
ncbi:2'-5' RNA ligase family protein [Variovorax sp. M-6]|uniref:2'-5' RNA ligase family protein n=1 Tax=Variovorax sp. M-6 TaxID=3233041 RepID=UPI003F9BBBB1